MAHPVVISATLIARNEERFLEDCLRSLAGVVDEIVLVDTGSLDATMDIARAFGVEPHRFPWIDDFSAARNYAIDQARGDWLLYIDADERVRPCDRAALNQALADPKLYCGTVQFHPRARATAYREFRLFRRHPKIRFEGAMHETFVPSLWKTMAEEGARLGPVDLVMDHLGYDDDQSAKLHRNLPLLEKQIAATPERAFLWWHLGTVLRDLGQTERAEAVFMTGVSLSEARGGMMAEEALCFIELAKAGLERGEAPLEIIDRGLALRPENLMLRWLKARALRPTAPEQAMAILMGLAAIDPDGLVSETSYDRRIMGAGAYAEMGYMAFGRDDAAAERYFAEARRMEPETLEYRLKHELALARLKGSAPR